jgi:hypothetical protein
MSEILGNILVEYIDKNLQDMRRLASGYPSDSKIGSMKTNISYLKRVFQGLVKSCNNLISALEELEKVEN